MPTTLALAAIRFYQRHLRHAGPIGFVLAGTALLGVGLAEIVSLPWLVRLAFATPAPLGFLLMLGAVLAALLGALILGVASLALGAPFSRCRYTPSCSNYAFIAYSRFGVFWGSLLAGARLLRCAPWGSTGWDPVPERKDGRADRLGTPRQVPPDKRHRQGQLLPWRQEV